MRIVVLINMAVFLSLLLVPPSFPIVRFYLCLSSPVHLIMILPPSPIYLIWSYFPSCVYLIKTALTFLSAHLSRTTCASIPLSPSWLWLTCLLAPVINFPLIIPLCVTFVVLARKLSRLFYNQLSSSFSSFVILLNNIKIKSIKILVLICHL